MRQNNHSRHTQPDGVVKDTVGSKLSRALEFPESIAPGMPQIELVGNREAIIEGCTGVLEYDDGVVKLGAGRLTVRFTGRDLQIKCMNGEQTVVVGYILTIEFNS